MCESVCATHSSQVFCRFLILKDVVDRLDNDIGYGGLRVGVCRCVCLVVEGASLTIDSDGTFV